jgi:hypothetical protein
MSVDDSGSDFIREPKRGEIIGRILNPREKCPEHQWCSRYGTRPPCELGPTDQKELAKNVRKLFELSDEKGWYPLRDAIQKLNSVGALKTCEVLTAFFSVTRKIRGEHVEEQAALYDSAREFGSERIANALKEVARLEKTIDSAEQRQPEVLQVKRFIEYKRALCNLVACGLKALEELYQIEGRASSQKVLREIHKATFRQNIKECLHPSSAKSSRRYWMEIQAVLDGVEEIVRRPNSKTWSEIPPRRKETVAGSTLRQETNKLSSSDEATLKRWFEMLAPDLYARFEKEEDQIALLTEVMEREPNFPPILSFLLPVALQYEDDFLALRTIALRSRPNP